MRKDNQTGQHNQLNTKVRQEWRDQGTKKTNRKQMAKWHQFLLISKYFKFKWIKLFT